MRDSVRNGNAAINRQEHGPILGLLHGTGEQVGEMFGPDHRNAQSPCGANQAMSLPANTGMNVNQIGPERSEPLAEICRLVRIERLDAQASTGSAS